MSEKLSIFFWAVILISLLGISCTPSFDKIVSKGLMLHKSGKISEAVRLIEMGLIESSSVKRFDALKLFISNNVIYERDNNEIRILYPVEIEFQIDDSEYDNIQFYFDLEARRVAYSNRNVIKLFSDSGDVIHSANLGLANDKKIRSIILRGDRLYYYCDGEMYFYAFDVRENAVLIKDEKFLPPFTGLSYTVSFVSSKDILGITSGIAGSYYSSFIDYGNDSVLLKNLRVSSSRLLINSDSVFYISGSPGDWFLERVSLSNKKKNKLHRFEYIVDLYFFDGGLIFEKRDGLWFADNTKRMAVRIPNTSQPIAAIMDRLLVRAGNSYYLIDLKDFLKKAVYLSELLPDIFKVDRDFFVKL